VFGNPGGDPATPRPQQRRDAIFISYRRTDSQMWTGRLADDLRDRFGPDRVYRDLNSNRAAQDYNRQIHEAIDRSRVVIAVIGPHWADVAYTNGRRRLGDPADLVRQELEKALSMGKAVVPLLVGAAPPPAARTLPSSLAGIARLQALRMDDEDWEYDFGRLLETLETHGVVPSISRPDEVPPDAKEQFAGKRHYERTFPASRRRAYDAVLGAVDILGYQRVDQSTDRAEMTFKLTTRHITVKVIDAGPARSRVVVEYYALRAGTMTAGVVAAGFLSGGALLLPAAGGWFAVRALERRFAKGFLENVQRVLEGRPIEKDSARLPGVDEWKKRSRDV